MTNDDRKDIVLMDFFAIWCGPCKIQDPILEELKNKYKDKVKFKTINVDEEQELSNKYLIHAVPTLIVEKNGNVFKKYVGVTTYKELVKTLDEALE